MRSSAARRTICARVLSRASRVEWYNVSKASSCSGLRVGIRIGFMGSSFSHKPTPLGNNLIVLRVRVRDFLRVGCQHRPAKSRKGHRRTPERRSVLHAQLAKVELKGKFSEVHLQDLV